MLTIKSWSSQHSNKRENSLGDVKSLSPLIIIICKKFKATFCLISFDLSNKNSSTIHKSRMVEIVVAIIYQKKNKKEEQLFLPWEPQYLPFQYPSKMNRIAFQWSVSG